MTSTTSFDGYGRSAPAVCDDVTGPYLPILTRCFRHNRPSYSGYNAYPSICIVSSRYKALWNTYPGPNPCRSGVHQGISIQFPTFFADLTTGPHLPQHDDQRVKDYGIKLSVEMIRRLVEEGGMRGFHFCTLNLEKSVQSTLEILGWTPGHAKPHTRLIAVSFL